MENSKSMQTLFVILKDLMLGLIVFVFPKVYAVFIAAIKYEDVRFFFESSKEFVQWVVSILILIKIIVELRKTLKK